MNLDAILHDLRLCGIDYRLAPEPLDPADGDTRFYSTCPCCEIPWALELVEGDSILDSDPHFDFWCWTGCSEFQIRRSLARDVHLSLAAELEAA